MIKSEYLRFLQTLNNSNISNDVRKIANLILANFDELAALTTYQGQRVKKIVSLAQEKWETLSEDIQPLPENIENQTTAIDQLKSMSVGPFRGFARQEIFDLASPLVLIYGPNGTGKTSFCEALEYGLLGNVVEADNRRFHEHEEYLRNAHVGQFSCPKIIAKNEQGEEIPVTPNEIYYRFCFIEKNRIDSFARIAAQTPAKQTELISTLFGLDYFSEFVRNFTPEVERYIDLIGEKLKILDQKRQALVGAQQQIQNYENKLQEITKEKQQLAEQYRPNFSFEDMVFELNGNEEAPGKIRKLEFKLQQPLRTKCNLTSSALDGLRNSLDTDIANLIIQREQLALASQQVSFKQLYEAVSQLQQSNLEQCPACQTPINQVSVDPYSHANKELEKLQQLGAMQEYEKKLDQSIKNSLFDLSQIINTCLSQLPEGNVLHCCQLSNSIQTNIEWYYSLFNKMSEGTTLWDGLVKQVEKLKQIDDELDKLAQTRNVKQAELEKLKFFSDKATKFRLSKEITEKSLRESELIIQKFNIENKKLIDDVDAEKIIIQKNKNIACAYSYFLEKLNNYNENLPEKLVADLGQLVVEIYNAFNRNGPFRELLAQVKLPLRQHQRLDISFKHDPQKFCDALHVLSEGHIRCLGLAILLAKNLKEQCPLLIFDDPVNAIDDEHREAIRKTLFEDNYFSKKQIILACHGEEFFKDIQNLLSVEKAKICRTFTFLPTPDEQHIRIDFNCESRNYIVSARECFDRGKTRDSLGKSRQALEAMTKQKIWKYVDKYGDANLSIKMRSHSAPIELRNLTEQLEKKIVEPSFSDTHKDKVLQPISELLGVDGNSREWRYLNKGTHEEQDRTEFDRDVVSKIISNLEKLDEALA